MLRNFLLVALGGGIGSMLRYGTLLMINAKYFPWSTLAVNIIGSFLIGLILALSIKEESILYNWKLFLVTGVCGGFTTFSAFSMENMELLQNGKYLLAATYIALSVVLGIAAAFAGFKLITINS